MDFPTSVPFLILLPPAECLPLSSIFLHPEVRFTCHIIHGHFLDSPLVRSGLSHPYSPVACVFLLVEPSCTVVQVVHSPAPGVPSLTVHASVFRWLPGSCAIPRLCGRVCSPVLQHDTGVLTFMWSLVFFLCLCRIDCCLRRGL